MLILKKISCLIYHYLNHKKVTTLPLPFYDDDLSHVSNSNEEEQDQNDLSIEAEPHEILYIDPTPIPN